MTNVEALRALFAALGGSSDTASGYSTTLECLNGIASQLGFSGTAASDNAGAIYNISTVASSAVAPELQNRTVTPTTSEQEITKTSSTAYGLGKVTVSAVTAAIDENIVAGNIKSGVVILGVTGSYTGE